MEEKKKVTVVEMTNTIAAQGNKLFQISFWQKAAECPNLEFRTEAKCMGIKENTVLNAGYGSGRGLRAGKKNSGGIL